MRVVPVDGVPVAAITEQEAVRHVLAEHGAGRGGLILTVNLDILRQLRTGAHDLLQDQSSLVVADGMPLVWTSILQGTPLPERVTGADLVWSLCAAAARDSLSVYLLGAAPGVAERAASSLQRASPGLKVAGWSSPPLGFQDDPAQVDQVLGELRSTRPDIIFVALGFPKQENVALLVRKALPGVWLVGCGGALDMAAGDVSRAPSMWQALGVEWVHRLLQEPRRLGRRYLVEGLPFAAGLIARAVLFRLRSGRGPGAGPGL